ncbi:MAG: hypothetical protein KatS3mg091_391 [Patescibacteria group bacterium]|nr:MAG: hypothetical protein KatS3mg091_391 [Patescibacteria group bacterium]
MIKKIFLSIITGALITTLIMSTKPALAHSDTAGASVDDIVSLILENQNIDNINQIDCTKVTDQEFEALGEALMDYMHPDQEEHQAMDKMMGGEGSESLSQAHIQMGKRYLGCDSLPRFIGMMDLMKNAADNDLKKDNYNNLTETERGWSNMMGFGMGMHSGPSIFGFLSFLTWVIIIIFLVLGSIYFWKEINKKK